MSNNKSRSRQFDSRPDDRPFDFNLDAVQADAQATPFVFQFSGRRWSVEHLGQLNAWQLLEAADQGEVAAMRSIFSLGLGEDWPAFRALPLQQFKLNALFAAYRKHCGDTPGESPASASS
jgi:hypothetical protein